MSLDFGVEGTSVLVAGELLSNPAAYVLLTVSRNSRSGFIVATGYYDGRPTRRLVDRAAVGGDLRSQLGDLAVNVRLFGTTQRTLSSAERIAGSGAVARRDALAMLCAVAAQSAAALAAPADCGSKPLRYPNPTSSRRAAGTH